MAAALARRRPSASVRVAVHFAASVLVLRGPAALGKTPWVLRIDLPGGCFLRLLEESDAGDLYALVDGNRPYLARWLSWVEETHGADDVLNFIRATRTQIAENKGLALAIVEGDSIIGIVGFNSIDWTHGSTAIGYWLAEGHQGRGTMTEAVRALVAYSFEVWKLNRVEIRAAVANVRSRAIPERLGFKQEGVLRQAERIGDRFEDLVVYSMLAREWSMS
jgi:ribosomal-protein-serine acetyltransferase